MSFSSRFRLLAFASFLAVSVATGETIDRMEKLLTVPTHPSVETSSWSSAVASHNGATYLVWVDDALNARIARYDHATDSYQTAVIFSEVFPDGHHKLSLGIDEQGYLHVAGDMHSHSKLRPDNEINAYADQSDGFHDSISEKERIAEDGDGNLVDTTDYSWQYWVSVNPGDISSFTFHGSTSRRPPGIHVSYPRFIRDRSGVLYATFRHRITPNNDIAYQLEGSESTGGSSYLDGPGYYSNGQFVRGTFAGGVARYDATSRTWKMLGGSDYRVNGEEFDPANDGQTYSQYSFSGDFPALMWHSKGREAGPLPLYQGFNNDIFFDVNNRMHLTWTVYSEDSSAKTGGFSTSHLMYAYSDDGGDTWHRADGSLIQSLPITIERGSVAHHQDAQYTNEGFAETGLTGGQMRGASFVVTGPNQNPRLFTDEWIGNPENQIDTRKTFWTGSGWDLFEDFQPDNLEVYMNVAGDLNGVMTGIRVTGINSSFLRSHDGGQTWERLTTSTLLGKDSSYAIDWSHLMNTSQLRLAFYDEDGSGSASTYLYDIEFSGATAPPAFGLNAPTDLTAQTDGLNPTGQINLSWTDNNDTASPQGNEDGFMVERRAEGGHWIRIEDGLPPDTGSYQDTGLAADTAYFYRVRSFLGAATSIASSEASATTAPTSVPPQTPTGLRVAQAGSGALRISWTDASSNEDGFRLERATSATGPFSPVVETGSDATGHTNSDLATSTFYYYRVRAFNENGTSGWSPVSSGVTGDNRILHWQFDETGADIPTDGSGNQIATDSSGNGRDGTIRIHQLGAGVLNLQDGFFEGVTRPSFPLGDEWTLSFWFTFDSLDHSGYDTLFQRDGTDRITVAQAGNQASSYPGQLRTWIDQGSNTWSFDVPADQIDANTWHFYAISYDRLDNTIKIYFDGAHLFTLDDLTGTWEIDTKTEAAVHANGQFDNLRIVSGVLDAGEVAALYADGHQPPTPAAPGDLSADSTGSTHIDLTWTDNSSDETAFVVETKAPGGVFAEQGAVPADTSSFTATGLSPDTTYVFRVKASTGGNDSAYSPELTVSTQPLGTPAAPSGLSAAADSATSITLTWADNSDNEAGFVVEADTGSGFAEWINLNSNVTAFQATGLSPGTAHTFRVSAFNAGGSSAYSSTATAATPSMDPPSPPSALSASVLSASRIGLTWTDNSDNEDEFILERKSGGGSFAVVATIDGNQTETTVSGLAENTAHTFRLRARNAGDDSAYSNEASATTPALDLPLAPDGLQADVLSSSGIQLAWNDWSDNENGFRIEYRPVGGSFALLGTTGADSTSDLATGLSPFTDYEFRVRAFNVDGDSSWSSVASARTNAATAPATPTALAASALSDSSIELFWSDNSSNELTFILELAAGDGSFQPLAELDADRSGYTVTGLQANTGYRFRVRAANGAGFSAWSNTAEARTHSPAGVVALTHFSEDFNTDALALFPEAPELSIDPDSQRAFLVRADTANLFSDITGNKYFSLDNQGGARAIVLEVDTGQPLVTLSFDWHQPAGSSADFRLRLDAFTDDPDENRFGRVSFENGTVASGSQASAAYAENTTYRYDIVYNNTAASVTVAGQTIPSQFFGVFREGQFLFSGNDQFQIGNDTGATFRRFEFNFRAVPMLVNLDNLRLYYGAVAEPLTLAEDWRLGHFGHRENLGNAEKSADPDADGRNNRGEYAFLTDPLTPDSPAPHNRIGLVESEGEQFLELRFDVHRDPLLGFEILQSETLGNDWTPVWSTGENHGNVSETLENDQRVIRYRIPPPSGEDSSEMFFRLRLVE